MSDGVVNTLLPVQPERTSGSPTFCGLRQIAMHFLPFSRTGASAQNGQLRRRGNSVVVLSSSRCQRESFFPHALHDTFEINVRD